MKMRRMTEKDKNRIPHFPCCLDDENRRSRLKIKCIHACKTALGSSFTEEVFPSGWIGIRDSLLWILISFLFTPAANPTLNKNTCIHAFKLVLNFLSSVSYYRKGKDWSAKKLSSNHKAVTVALYIFCYP